MGFTARPQLSTAFDFDIIYTSASIAIIRISGKTASKFEEEAGGHRWQRIPPTEKRDRVHTSTITVVVYPEPTEVEIKIDPKDLEEQFTRGSGPGGQHRNKTETAVILKHIPTGISVRAEDNKSQKQNRENALALLRAKIFQIEKDKKREELSKLRKDQAGNSMRGGDKVRTIMVQHNRVIHHKNNKECTYKEYTKGKLTLLW
ncbi:MAG: peptide chain release factor-like protein [Candidatus Paceibacterota bacterium]